MPRRGKLVHALRLMFTMVAILSILAGVEVAPVSASGGSEFWVARYTAGQQNYAADVAISPDGTRVYVTGSHKKVVGYPDYATVAYDTTTGMQLWEQRYNGPGNNEDYATALGVSPDGSDVFVTGVSSGSASRDYATVAYDATTGAKQWVNRYNAPGDGDDYADSLGVSPDGATVFVTGASTSGPDTPRNYATVAYDSATGAKQWVSRYTGPGNSDDSAQSLAVSPDGTKVFVTGFSMGSTTSYDFATLAYDSATGSRLWVKRYNGPGNGGDYASSLGVSPDGTRVFVTGGGQGLTTSDDYATVAYEASTGSRLWVKRYNGPGNGDDYPSSLGVSPDGTRVFVTGYGPGSTSLSDYATVAYDAATGARQWVRRYNGPNNREDQATSLAVSPDGERVYVTGTSRVSSRASDYATVAYSTT